MDLLWFDKSIISKSAKLRHVNLLYIKCAFCLHVRDYMSPWVSSVICQIWKSSILENRGKKYSLSFYQLLCKKLKKKKKSYVLTSYHVKDLFWVGFLSICNNLLYKQRCSCVSNDTSGNTAQLLIWWNIFCDFRLKVLPHFFKMLMLSMLYRVRPAMFFLLSPLPSLPFLSASLIIQCWQFLPSSSSSDPGMLWPGLASLLVPWAWQRVLPWPHVRLQ